MCARAEHQHRRRYGRRDPRQQASGVRSPAPARNRALESAPHRVRARCREQIRQGSQQEGTLFNSRVALEVLDRKRFGTFFPPFKPLFA